MAFYIWFSFVYLLLTIVYLLVGVNSRRKKQKAALKCLPIALLVGVVLWRWQASREQLLHGQDEVNVEKTGKHKMLLLGLVLSGLGDGCLVAPLLVVFGIAFFGIAQCVYVLMFGLSFKIIAQLSTLELLCGGIVSSVSLLLLLFFGWHFHLLLKSGDHGIRRRFIALVMPLVLVYFILISLMLWSALLQAQRRMDQPSFLGAAGGFLFYVSDILIAAGAVWKWRVLLHGRILVMFTYYGAQYLITLSVLQ